MKEESKEELAGRFVVLQRERRNGRVKRRVGRPVCSSAERERKNGELQEELVGRFVVLHRERGELKEELAGQFVVLHTEK